MNSIQKLAEKLIPYQVKIELILLVLLILGMTVPHFSFGFLLIILPLATLGMMYYFLAFRKIKTEYPMDVFVNKLTHISFSVAMIGILFSNNHYPRAKVMLMVALMGIVVGLILQMIVKRKDEEKELFDINTLRMIIIAALVVYFMYFGNGDLVVANR